LSKVYFTIFVINQEPLVSKHKISRRRFVASTALSTAAIGAGSTQNIAAEPSSKNDRLNIGWIGCGARGGAIAAQAKRFGDIVAVCDVDKASATAANKRICSGKATVYQDYRELLARADVDVVLNATPDHWHTAIAIAACKAGKDLYTEKPLTLTIDEGKHLQQVVKETGRVVQVGTQQRSGPTFQRAVELVRNGRLGKIKQVWVPVPYFGNKVDPFKTSKPPASLDWDLYQGQTPEHEYCAQRVKRTFRWWYEYSGGMCTDWGNHHIDIAHWGLDVELSGPTSIDARGIFANEGKANCYNTADRFFSRMQYAGGVEVLFFTAMESRRGWGGKVEQTSEKQLDWLFGKDVPAEIRRYKQAGIMFIGEEGRIFVNRGKVAGKPVEELAKNPLPKDAWRVQPSKDHMANFFTCVKNRKEPVSPVPIQHRTVTACHLTNISLRLGRPLKWDPAKEQIVGDDEANGWQTRKQRAPYTT
jgi:myo-inositol 2-dehydrogenase/D-chiro-inositol 1-dehydrogenase